MKAKRNQEGKAMIEERKTLGELLSDPLIVRIRPDAIRRMDQQFF